MSRLDRDSGSRTMSRRGGRRGRLAMLMCLPLGTDEEEVSAQPKPKSRKKMSKKALLKELDRLEEDLMREIQSRESLQEQREKEKEEWIQQRNGWIQEIENTEKLRRAETQAYQVCLREQCDKLEKELELKNVLIRLETDTKIQQLEAALVSERELLHEEREKFKLDIQMERKLIQMEMDKKVLEMGTAKDLQREKLEKLVLSFEDERKVWNELTNQWATKLLEKESELEELRTENAKVALDFEKEIKRRCEIEETWQEYTEQWGKMLRENGAELKAANKEKEEMARKLEELSMKQLKQAQGDLLMKNFWGKSAKGKAEQAMAQISEDIQQMRDTWKKEKELLELKLLESQIREAQQREEIDALLRKVNGLKKSR